MADATDDEGRSRRRPWYADGLRFSCTGCGRCCTGGDSYVWIAPEEIRALAAAMQLDVDDFGRRYLRLVGRRYALLDGPDGNCVFLRGRSCAVYERRPAQCRSFPFWPANLGTAEEWGRTANRCEGISADAPLVAAETIERALADATAAGLTAAGAQRGSRERAAGQGGR